MKLTFLKSENAVVAWVDDQRVLTGGNIPTLISALERTIRDAKQDGEEIVAECPLSYGGKNHLPFSEAERQELEVQLHCFTLSLTPAATP